MHDTTKTPEDASERFSDITFTDPAAAPLDASPATRADAGEERETWPAIWRGFRANRNTRSRLLRRS